VVATVIFSRSLDMPTALFLAAISVFVGPFLLGVAVAETIGRELAAPQQITLPVTIAALLSAIVWKIITGYLGLPASSSHSLVGGLVGGIMARSGVTVLQTAGLLKVGMALSLSPVLGLLAGYGIMQITLYLARGATPRLNDYFKRGQLVTAVTLALSHGANNSQKTMGLLALGLVALRPDLEFSVPFWVKLASAAAIALGTLFGGRRIIKTLGGRFYKIRPIHGFTSQLTAAAVIGGAAILGGPVSTTQTVSSSIIGVGSAERLNKVRWGIFYNIGVAWLLTFPVTIALGALFYYAINFILMTIL